MAYVDGFVLPVPRRKLGEYRRVARAAGKIWMEFGALSYQECVGDDVRSKAAAPFRKCVRLKPGEAVFFSFIVYKSKADRNRINAKIMKDPRILKLANPKRPVFDMKRMAYGGFKTVVNL
jgi:uncharacterized protein YbaA (DUF1428 family)